MPLSFDQPLSHHHGQGDAGLVADPSSPAGNPLRHWAAEHSLASGAEEMDASTAVPTAFGQQWASPFGVAAGDLRLITAGLQAVQTTTLPPPRVRPRRYVRQDARIREDICERLHHAREIDTRDVTVNVEDGRLRFEGSVPQRSMKAAIEALVETCLGVKEIDNRMRVRRPLRLHANDRA